MTPQVSADPTVEPWVSNPNPGSAIMAGDAAERPSLREAEAAGTDLRKRSGAEVEEVIDVKDATKALMKIEEDLADYQRAKNLAPLDLAVTEKDVDKILMSRARQNMIDFRSDGLWCTSFKAADGWAVIGGPAVGTGSVVASIALLCGVPFLLALLIGLPGVLAGMMLGAMGIQSGIHPYLSIRNKVIHRKKYQRTIRSIVDKNIDNAERHQQLLRAKERKLERAKRRVEELAPYYEQNNPGKTLELSFDYRQVVEVRKPASSRVEALAHRIATKTTP